MSTEMGSAVPADAIIAPRLQELEYSIEAGQHLQQAADLLILPDPSTAQQQNNRLNVAIEVCQVLKSAGMPTTPFIHRVSGDEEDLYKSSYAKIDESSLADLVGTPLHTLQEGASFHLGRPVNLDFDDVARHARARVRAGADITAEIEWLQSDLERVRPPEHLDEQPPNRIHDYIKFSRMIYDAGGDSLPVLQHAHSLLHAGDNSNVYYSGRATALGRAYAQQGRIEEARSLISEIQAHSEAAGLKRFDEAERAILLQVLTNQLKTEDYQGAVDTAQTMLIQDYSTTEIPEARAIRLALGISEIKLREIRARGKLGEDVQADLAIMNENIKGMDNGTSKISRLFELADTQYALNDPLHEQTLSIAHDVIRVEFETEDSFEFNGETIHEATFDLDELAERYLEYGNLDATQGIVDELIELPYADAREKAAVLLAKLVVAKLAGVDRAQNFLNGAQAVRDSDREATRDALMMIV